MVADASGAPIIIACDAFNLGLDGTSTLNTRVQITGNGATVSMSGMGNIETWAVGVVSLRYLYWNWCKIYSF